MLSKAIRNLIPRRAVTAARFISIFNRDFGHGRRHQGLCLDGQGHPIPWITYPCLEFLSRLDFSACSIFEYGSGSSTLWWAARAQNVRSVERETDWYQLIKPRLPSNAQLELCADETRYADTILATGTQFDVVVIDGAVRFPCAQALLPALKSTGIIILDNTEWYPNLAGFLREKGFFQLDFCGFGPINAFTSCTSVFFRDPALLANRLEKKEWTPIGGRFLNAHDDQKLETIDPAALRRS